MIPRDLTYDRHTYIPIDIPREISIEHPSVGLASLAQLRTYVSMRSKIIKQEVKLSSVVCPYEGFKSMGVKVIKTQEMCKL